MTSVGVMASSVVPVTAVDVLLEPFNNLTFAPWTTISGAPTFVTGRTGTALRLGDSSGTTVVRYTIPSLNESDTVTLGFAWRTTNIAAGQRLICQLRSDTDTTDHVGLFYTTTGQLRIMRATTTELGITAAGLVAINTFYYLELQTKLGDAGVGTIELRRNGVAVIGPTTVDTRESGTKSTFDSVRLSGYPSASNNQQFDDLYITTGAGAPFKGDTTVP